MSNFKILTLEVIDQARDRRTWTGVKGDDFEEDMAGYE
jgi:hypothetical protein